MLDFPSLINYIRVSRLCCCLMNDWHSINF